MPIEWDDLRIFQNAVRTGDYSTAARRLGINRTTVGRRLARLEAAIGRSLWEQGMAGYRPTSVGQAVLRAASAMEHVMVELADELELGDNAISGVRVRLTGTADIAQLLLPKLAGKLEDGGPSLELVGLREAMLAVSQRRADLGIAIARNKPRMLDGTRVGPFQQALYVRKGASDGPRIGYGHAMMLANPQAWAKLNASPTVAMEVDGLFAMVEAVRAGLGAAWLWTAIGDKMPELQRLDEEPPAAAAADIWVVHRADITIEPGVKLMHDIVVDTIVGMLAD